MLYHAIFFEFSYFGACIVGIFRKNPIKPYAIVQYTVSLRPHSLFARPY